MRIVLFIASLLLHASTLVSSHLLYINTDAEYTRFTEHHDVYRLVIYDPAHVGSLRLLEKLKRDGGHVATAAVLASGVSEYRDSEIPRIITVDRREGNSGGSQRRRAAAVDDTPPQNLVEYGKHHALVNTRHDPHYLMLVGHQLPGVAVSLFSVAAGEEGPTKGKKFVFARPSAETEHLFNTFGFKPWKKHQAHFVVNGKSVHDARSFEFGTREEFEAEWKKAKEAHRRMQTS